MPKFIGGVIVGAALVFAGLWIMSRSEQNAADQKIVRLQSELADARQKAEQLAASVAVDARRAGDEVGDEVAARMNALELSKEVIMRELEQTGQVVRKRARSLSTDAITAAMDTVSTASIKSRIARDGELSVFDISVATEQGTVTLSGEVESPEAIGRAMAIALNTENVDTVISTLNIEQGADAAQSQSRSSSA